MPGLFVLLIPPIPFLPILSQIQHNSSRDLRDYSANLFQRNCSDQVTFSDPTATWGKKTTEILVTTGVRLLEGHAEVEPIIEDSASGRDGLLAVVLAAWLAAH